MKKGIGGVALLLYGRVGTYTHRAADLTPDLPGDPALWRNCAQSIQRHIVAPWREAGALDLFVQSWNPELAVEMDAYWKPAASWHAAQKSTFSCSPLTRVRVGFCERTWWAMLGMRHALELRTNWASSRTSHIRPRQYAHDTVVVMRHDLFWLNPLPVVVASPAATRLWLPFNCELDRQATRHLLQNSTPTVTPRAASSIFGHRCGEQQALPPDQLDFCDNTIQIDWFFIADPEIADGFVETSYDYFEYIRKVRVQLVFKNAAPHFLWGLYFFHRRRLRTLCQVGHVAMAHLDFKLGRAVDPVKGKEAQCRLEGMARTWTAPTALASRGGDMQARINASDRRHRQPEPDMSQSRASVGIIPAGVCNASAISGYAMMCPVASALDSSGTPSLEHTVGGGALAYTGGAPPKPLKLQCRPLVMNFSLPEAQEPFPRLARRNITSG